MVKQLNGFTLYRQSNGNFVIECDGCGQTATYSTEARAIGNMSKRHCQPVDSIPFDGEPTPTRIDGNGLTANVDY